MFFHCLGIIFLLLICIELRDIKQQNIKINHSIDKTFEIEKSPDPYCKIDSEIMEIISRESINGFLEAMLILNPKEKGGN